jgi:hypothetical protein
MANDKQIIDDVKASVEGLTGAFGALAEMLKTNLSTQKDLIKDLAEIRKQYGSTKEIANLIKLKKDHETAETNLTKKQKEALQLTKLKDSIDSAAAKTKQAAINAAMAQERQQEAVIQAKMRTENMAAAQKARLNKEQEKATKTARDAASAYVQQSRRLSELTRQAKDAAVAYGVNSKQARALRAEQQKLDATLKSVDKSLGLNQRNVGNYGSAFGKISGILGQFGVALGGARLAMSAFNLVVKNSQEAGDAWAITVAGIKGSFEGLGQAIGTGERTIGGMIRAMRTGSEAARQYAAALDDLFEGGEGARLLTASLDEEIVKLEIVRKTRVNSNEVRLEAAERIAELELQKLAIIQKENEKTLDMEADRLRRRTNLRKEDLISFLENYRAEEDTRKRMQEFLKEEIRLDEIRRKGTTTAYGKDEGQVTNFVTKQAEQAAKELSDLRQSLTKDEMVYARIIQRYQGTTDEMVKKLVDAEVAIRNARSQSTRQQQRNETDLAKFRDELKNDEISQTNDVILQTNDLIKIQEALLVKTREMSGATEEEIALRNRKVTAIEAEISRLRALGQLQQVEPINLDATIKQLEADIAELDALDDIEIKKYLEKEQEKTRTIKEETDKRVELQKKAEQDVYEFSKDAMNGLFERRNVLYDRELDANTKYYDNILANQQLDEEQRSLIEAQREQKENVIREKQKQNELKQFKFNQSIKIGEVAVNTLTEIAKIKNAAAGHTAALNPIGAGLALSQIPFVKLSGALAIGSILAQTLPAFAKGTKNAPEGFAKVGEEGVELVIEPNKKAWFTSDSEEIRYLKKGSQVITNDELVNAVSNTTNNQIVNNGDVKNDKESKLIAAMVTDLLKENKRGTKQIVNAVKSNRHKQDSTINKLRTEDLRRRMQN